MINLQNLLLTNVDSTIGGVQTGKTGGDAAQDFLALLAGALGAKTEVETTGENPLAGVLTGETDVTGEAGQGAGKTTLLSFSDLLTKGSVSPGLAATPRGADAAQTPAQKLADLLARQTTVSGTAAAPLSRDETEQVKSLLSSLTPAVKNDMLAALGKNATTTKDSATDLSDEELASLSALMAMLPHQQTAQLTPVAKAVDTAVTTSARSAGVGAQLAEDKLSNGKLAPETADTGTLPARGKADSAASSLTAANGSDSFQTAMQTVKKEADSATQTVTTTASLAPVVGHGVATQASAPVSAAVLSAPLGSNEWQQTLSQHVTLFTRQGQQSAELHLHPEELGQIQISLKIDENTAQLQMVSPHSHVRQALEAALPTLRISLAESGIQLGQSNISSESFTGQQQQSFSGQQQSSRSGNGERFAAEDDESLIAPASLQSVARGTGAVDIFA